MLSVACLRRLQRGMRYLSVGFILRLQRDCFLAVVAVVVVVVVVFAGGGALSAAAPSSRCFRFNDTYRRPAPAEYDC